MNGILRDKLELLIATIALGVAISAEAGESFRCGQWIITDELTLAELRAKCGEPSSKTAETVQVRGKAGTGSVSRGTSTTEHWTYVLSSGANYVVTVVDGEIKKIERTK
jgi:hypothetical protein